MYVTETLIVSTTFTSWPATRQHNLLPLLLLLLLQC
jgi:hypothetical protein